MYDSRVDRQGLPESLGRLEADEKTTAAGLPRVKMAARWLHCYDNTILHKYTKPG